jgi:hypothetical protein
MFPFSSTVMACNFVCLDRVLLVNLAIISYFGLGIASRQDADYPTYGGCRDSVEGVRLMLTTQAKTRV